MPTPRPPVGGCEEGPSERISFEGRRFDARAGASRLEQIMAFVRIEQRNAHLAGAVRLTTVEGREGPVSKATLTAISNTRRGSGDNRGEEATAIQWTLWGRQAENAAQFLTKGSHVNLTGRLQNNQYEKDGQMVYGWVMTAEEVDYLDSKASADALRARQAETPQPAPTRKSAPRSRAAATEARAD
jgi:single-strand DNA-binding protein